MPNVDRECVTHHSACDCREDKFRRMEEVLEGLEMWATAKIHIHDEWDKGYSTAMATVAHYLKGLK